MVSMSLCFFLTVCQEGANPPRPGTGCLFYGQPAGPALLRCGADPLNAAASGVAQCNRQRHEVRVFLCRPFQGFIPFPQRNRRQRRREGAGSSPDAVGSFSAERLNDQTSLSGMKSASDSRRCSPPHPAGIGVACLRIPGELGKGRPLPLRQLAPSGLFGLWRDLPCGI